MINFATFNVTEKDGSSASYGAYYDNESFLRFINEMAEVKLDSNRILGGLIYLAKVGTK